MHRPTTLNPFGPIKGSFWTPKLQKIKWGEYCGTPCIIAVLTFYKTMNLNHFLYI